MNHPQPLFSSTRRYVRITSRRDGYVEFDFSVGDADLAVELIMNNTMFEHFCRINEVQTLGADDSGIERSRERWRFEG
ncbi:phenol hydroxylase [Paraburkholderia sp. CNPSo 3157]|uniref:Phenol hydroxylase n=1 Tax=Paraburkholderia franconis TaxID=2654983 RepID=A0A7X1NJ51_9BURK|nr:phenol hydroxylase subunit [Paraburkholderia franconis]MPW22938.1 phenol hydroxylase [Paraburkholderia franconis]